MNFLLKSLFPSITWNIPREEKTIFLTFDDGPIPEVTPFVLSVLKDYNARATFFCVGENAKKNPGLLKMIKESGHSLGNHTMNHLNGWKTENDKYFANTEACDKYVDTRLFRPPYGKMTYSQIVRLKKKYRIIMWDVLSKDYDRNLTGIECLERVRRKTKSGSIVVFHDSLKAEERLRFALPETLKHFSSRGYRFEAII